MLELWDSLDGFVFFSLVILLRHPQASNEWVLQCLTLESTHLIEFVTVIEFGMFSSWSRECDFALWNKKNHTPLLNIEVSIDPPKPPKPKPWGPRQRNSKPSRVKLVSHSTYSKCSKSDCHIPNLQRVHLKHNSTSTKNLVNSIEQRKNTSPAPNPKQLITYKNTQNTHTKSQNNTCQIRQQ